MSVHFVYTGMHSIQTKKVVFFCYDIVKTKQHLIVTYGIFDKNGNVLRPYARPYVQVSTPVAKKVERPYL